MRTPWLALLFVGAATLGACTRVELAVELSADELVEVRGLSGLDRMPPSPTNRYADDSEAAELGRKLFFDKRLSGNGKISCATCHDPDCGFSDGKETSEGVGLVNRNAPSLWNTAYGFWWAWDGRADSLWAQALHPIEGENEMGSSRSAVAKLVRGDKVLNARYRSVFGKAPEEELVDRIFANVGKAIAAHERRIISNNSLFDQFVQGLQKADQTLANRLSPEAQRGLKIFIGKGQCTLCHSGPNFSDGEFHNIGLSPPAGTDVDLGRYDGVAMVTADPFNGRGAMSDDTSEAANMRLTFVAQKMNNMGEFKTPSLRNVVRTAPYMHDGRFQTLEEVVDYYSTLPGKAAVGHREESLKPLALSIAERTDLVAFLRCLTDDSAAAGLRAPPETK